MTSTASSVRAPVRLGVPWLTVLPLAAVMAYADGFWMLTLRGAVGAIERTQEPFVSWLRESTLVLPLFILAVLGALTLAQLRYGAVLRTPRAVAATGLLVAAAGTVLGATMIVGSSAYDYHLESDLLGMMDTMRNTCAGNCLALQQQSTFAAIVRAVLYTSAFILMTNLILVGWVLAMSGGRLAVTSSRGMPVTSTGPRPADSIDLPGETDSRLHDLRQLLVAALLGSAAIHATLVPDQLTQWPAAGTFFIMLTAAELVIAALLLTRQRRATLIAAVVVSAGPLLLWLYSRTIGLPVGPAPGRPSAVGLSDIICCALEIVVLSVAVQILRRAGRPAQQPAWTAQTRWLGLVAIIAATAIGIAGATPAWFEGSDSPPETTMSH